MAISDTLLLFAKANMAAINTCGLRALELGRDPSRALRDIFVINLCPNYESSHSEAAQAFAVIDASVISASDTGPESGKSLELLADKNNYAKSIGFMGALVVMLAFENAGKTHRIRFPIVFENNALKNALQHDTSITPWLVQLKAAINDGIL
jgi:hypothetical protein